MDSYESARWEEIQSWRSTAVRGFAARLPEPVRDGATHVAQRAAGLWQKVPGNEALETALASAIKGGFDIAMDVTESTIKERKVLERVTKGLTVEATSYADLRHFDLAILDKRAPKNAKKRAVLAAGHGAAAGLVAGGATSAGASTGGMGALPGLLRWPSSPTPPRCRSARSRAPRTSARTMAMTRDNRLNGR